MVYDHNHRAVGPSRGCDFDGTGVASAARCVVDDAPEQSGMERHHRQNLRDVNPHAVARSRDPEQGRADDLVERDRPRGNNDGICFETACVEQVGDDVLEAVGGPFDRGKRDAEYHDWLDKQKLQEPVGARGERTLDLAMTVSGVVKKIGCAPPEPPRPVFDSPNDLNVRVP